MSTHPSFSEHIEERQITDDYLGAVTVRRGAAAARDEPLGIGYEPPATMVDYALLRYLHAIDHGYPIDGLAVAAGLGDIPLLEAMMEWWKLFSLSA